MTKFRLKIFLKCAYELILVFLQFFLISLHFFQWEFIPQKQIIQVTPFSYLVGFLTIIIAFIMLIVAIKDLGRNLSPFPRPVNNSNLVNTGIYRFMRHPMYYSLILISFGFFITKLSFYYLILSISLGLIIKFKIALEEQYLNKKFKNYLLYKNEVKY
ncbi:methyltransferase family protein [Prochlorococcus marinus]|uniref:methyltransferase family protein n=1 Tax=Prochlorococcus marinus TaxID=1219 RepID=UPI001ADA31F1|nr:methyltransferase [Prochlorococcus marinus]MBO8219347.1 isoprenylcysteine carboxylmethyltransferase family protein [Prochlorococcus marinus CUG1416]MBW3051728.1 S-isoprenylcysteine methyltransferase [Prochlorococcus marinus str. MU1416]